MCNSRPFSVGCFNANPAPNGVTFASLVISVHSKAGVSRPRTRTGKWSGRRSRIRFQFRRSLMGGGVVGSSRKQVGSGYTKLLILLEFRLFDDCQQAQKKLKYGLL